MPERGEKRALDIRAVLRSRGLPPRLEVVLQEEARGLSNLFLDAVAVAQDGGEVVVEVGDPRALLQALVHLRGVCRGRGTAVRTARAGAGEDAGRGRGGTSSRRSFVRSIGRRRRNVGFRKDE